MFQWGPLFLRERKLDSIPFGDVRFLLTYQVGRVLSNLHFPPFCYVYSRNMLQHLTEGL
jgi:hypothetical protein